MNWEKLKKYMAARGQITIQSETPFRAMLKTLDGTDRTYLIQRAELEALIGQGLAEHQFGVYSKPRVGPQVKTAPKEKKEITTWDRMEWNEQMQRQKKKRRPGITEKPVLKLG